MKEKGGGVVECIGLTEAERDIELDTVHNASTSSWECGRKAHRPRTSRCLGCHRFLDW